MLRTIKGSSGRTRTYTAGSNARATEQAQMAEQVKAAEDTKKSET
jgi:hypothetical protein